jgi:hypothetical protein
MAKSRYKDMNKYKASLKKTAEANKARREAVKKNGKVKLVGKHLSHASKGGAKIESAKKNMTRPRKGKGSTCSGKGSYTTKLNAKRGRPKKG